MCEECEGEGKKWECGDEECENVGWMCQIGEHGQTDGSERSAISPPNEALKAGEFLRGLVLDPTSLRNLGPLGRA
jgi:hypothetical protein